MQSLSRETAKKLFKRVKKLYIPEEIETVNYGPIVYYSWYDAGQAALYVVSDVRAETKLEGIRFEVNISSTSVKLGYCDICKSQRRLTDTPLITARTRYKPKGVIYISRGCHICLDYIECNKALKERDLAGNVKNLFDLIDNRNE